MEELYIRVVDGKPDAHPALKSNILQAFGEIDPQKWVKFERVEKPRVGLFEVDEGTDYELIDGVYKDVHKIRPMTTEEKEQKLNHLYEVRPHATWTIDRETGDYVPPVPYPDDGKIYAWDDTTDNWIDREVSYAQYQYL